MPEDRSLFCETDQRRRLLADFEGFEATLTADMAPDALVAEVDDPGSLVVPAVLVLEPDDDARREYVRFSRADGNQLVVDDPSARYLPGSAASAGLGHPAGSVVRLQLYGIDYLEVPWNDQRRIRLYLVPDDFPDAIADLLAGAITVRGGIRVKHIDVTGVEPRTDDQGSRYLQVAVDRAGDFSLYVLSIDHPLVDPVRSRKRFSFKAGCPSDLDCGAPVECPPEELEEPLIDYMAKDYASFRRLLTDLIPATVPSWTTRSPADLGIALLELLADEGDLLSYRQDAVANELFVETARRRESVRRHTRLIDYPMHDGCNARTFVHLRVTTPGSIPAGTQFLTRISRPLGLGWHGAVPGPEILAVLRERALAVADAVFEAVDWSEESEGPSRWSVHPDANEMIIHTWGDDECCVEAGTTSLTIVGHPPLQEGQFLLLQETRGVSTLLPQDVDPEKRHVVRLTSVRPSTDRLMTLQNGEPAPRRRGDPALPITHLDWGVDDALPFPICVSVAADMGQARTAVARGNLVLVDHGRTLDEEHVVDDRSFEHSRLSYRFRLREGPLTFRSPIELTSGASGVMRVDPGGARPQIDIEGRISGAAASLPRTWAYRPDLLRSGRFEPHFTVETDHLGTALVRFGDGEFGRAPAAGEVLDLQYRVGQGLVGNVGREAIGHVIVPQVPPDWPGIEAVTNPLPALGGTEPEPLEVVKRLAPEAFRAIAYRAVTEGDYAEAAAEVEQVASARGTFRWTGSWHTVSVAVDERGAGGLSPQVVAQLLGRLEGRRLAGYDLDVDPAVYVPLEIAIRVCVLPTHFRSHVKKELLEVLSNRALPGGRRGFFHPDEWTFGQPVFLSRLYQVIEGVEGVDWAEVVTFKRLGQEPNRELERGRIKLGRLEIARLDNDPSFPERGVLALGMLGGK